MDAVALGTDIGLVGLLGGLANLDRKGAFQLMLHQPLVVVPAIGLLTGDLQTGLWLGAVLQLLWMSSFLVGAQVPPNETLAASVIGGGVLVYGHHLGAPDPAVQAIAILLGAPLGILGRQVDVRLDAANLQLAERADEAARACEPGALGRLPFVALLRTLIVTTCITAVGVALSVALLFFVRPNVAGALERALEVVGLYLLPSLGLAVALSTVRRRRALAVAAVCFVAVTFALQHAEAIR